ncbi:uncharacterized protein METZ01_LOCUS62958 [marine metagenome]|uniref:Uncharacterized protein n=1 Tax=marine metagenome TaxID=408172 RepID=A0A381T313_9ZZZZ
MIEEGEILCPLPCLGKKKITLPFIEPSIILSEGWPKDELRS